VFGSPTSLLFRLDIVWSRHAFYNESNLHADTEACLENLESHDFGFLHEVLTFTRVREGSLTSFSDKFQTDLPHELYALVTYGPKYLRDGECIELLEDEGKRVALQEEGRRLEEENSDWHMIGTNLCNDIAKLGVA
jgi:hypothetical protein